MVSFTVMMPSVGSNSFNNNRINVDFPEPLSPTTKTNPPSSIYRFTSVNAGIPAEYDLLTCSNLIISLATLSFLTIF